MCSILHDLILSQAGGVSIHSVASARCLILNEAETERTTSVLVTGELLNGGIGVLGGVETYNTSAARSAIRFILNLGLLHLADSGEQLYEILVTG